MPYNTLSTPIVTLKKLIELIESGAEEFGIVLSNDNGRKEPNAIKRNALKSDSSGGNNTPFFGYIRPEQAASGPYQDMSYVIFPLTDDSDNIIQILVCLIVGSLGFNHDIENASLPFWRREFMTLKEDQYKPYYKASFTDIESSFDSLKKGLKKDLKDQINDIYFKTILAGEIIDFEDVSKDKENVVRILKWLATYSYLRDWGSNAVQRKHRQKFLPTENNLKSDNHYEKILQLLKKDKYVVLQGAPGTGKTYTANQLKKNWIEKEGGEVFLTQFHAETSYADFVWGLKPDINSNNDPSGSATLNFKEENGVLLNAILKAEEFQSKYSSGKVPPVLLIVDEINRANLANVLGPVFYLFEKDDNNHSIPLKIGSKEISRLPENLYVVATMNTADRSIAVVDFALRRRFTWYTMKPHQIEADNFQKECYNEMSRIFRKYASDEELNLQPGQSYFIADSKDAMKDRVIYELAPLIKEYLSEGYLSRARNELAQFVLSYGDINLYE